MRLHFDAASAAQPPRAPVGPRCTEEMARNHRGQAGLDKRTHVSSRFQKNRGPHLVPSCPASPGPKETRITPLPVFQLFVKTLLVLLPVAKVGRQHWAPETQVICRSRPPVGPHHKTNRKRCPVPQGNPMLAWKRGEHPRGPQLLGLGICYRLDSDLQSANLKRTSKQPPSPSTR